MIDGQGLLTVNGRDIHSFLAIGKDYSNWIRAQIKRAHLIENMDYIVFAQMGKNPHAGRPLQEYAFTFDAAKHICMRSSTDKGHEIRRYFLDCEAQWQQAQQQPAIPTVHNPSIQRIIDLAVQIDRTEQLALEAQRTAADATRRAEVAEAKADMAIAEVRMMTMEDFVLSNGLLKQMPRSDWTGYVNWLKEFCAYHGLPIRKDPIAGRSWDGENVYPITALGALLRHVQTRPKQVALIHPITTGNADA
jgi:phage anti-repressor protein